MSDNTMPERIAPIELIAHGDGWRNVEYIRADIAQAQLDAANARIAELEGNLSALRYDRNLYHEMAQQQLKGIHNLQTCIIERDARIAELEAAQRWIGVDERLPDDEDDGVIAWTNNASDYKSYNFDLAFYHKNFGWLMATEWEHGDPTVTHWMPLPPPPVTDVTP